MALKAQQEYAMDVTQNYYDGLFTIEDESDEFAVFLKNKNIDLLKLILKEYADMNYKEIGRQLGITEGNVKVRVFRAKAQLLKLIGEEDVYLP